MTMPPDESGAQAQVLIKLGEMGADLAVIKNQMISLSDHEQRLRKLEAARWPLPTIAVVAAIGATAAAWIAALHH